MRTLIAAIAFMTRIPVGRWVNITREDVGRSARWFPIVGALLGLIQAGVVRLALPHLPVWTCAVLVILTEALVTGALHFDGLADTFDGMGGGHTREDVLRIMRDHAIGTYGSTALLICVLLKASLYVEFMRNGALWTAPLILAPALGRWCLLPLSCFLPYARESASVAREMGLGELAWATFWSGALVFLLAPLAGAWSWLALAAIAALWGLYCRHRIGGVTGDTLGACVQYGEAATLIVFAVVGRG